MTSITQGTPHPVGPFVNRPSSIRTTWPLAAIIAAILGHGVFGRTFPSSIGWQEMIIGGLLMIGLLGACLHRSRQPSLVDRHWWIAACMVVLVIVMGATIGLASGHPLRQFVRDLVPAGFLLLPIIAWPLLQQQSQRVFDMLLLSLEAAGAMLALRVLISTGFAMRPGAWIDLMGGSDGGISVDPLILYSAGAAICQLAQGQLNQQLIRQPFAFMIHVTSLGVSSYLILAFAQRLPFILVVLMLILIPMVLIARRNLSVAGILTIIAVCCLLAELTISTSKVQSDNTRDDGFSIAEQMYKKQRDQGSHAKIREAQTVWATVAVSPVKLAFGTGLGSTFRNPVLQDRLIGYTHALPTYLLLKFGLVGCAMLSLPILLLLCSHRIDFASLPMQIAIASAVGVGVLTQATHKSLPFFLLIALSGGFIASAAWRRANAATP